MPLSDWDAVLKTILGVAGVDRTKVTEQAWLTHAGFWSGERSLGQESGRLLGRIRRSRAELGSFLAVERESDGFWFPWVTKANIDYYTNGSDGQYRGYWDASAGALRANPIANLDRSTFDVVSGAFLRADNWLTGNIGNVEALIAEIDTEASGFQGSAAESFLLVLRNIREIMRTMQADMTAGTGTWATMLAENGTAVAAFISALQTALQSLADSKTDPRTIIHSILTQIKANIEDVKLFPDGGGENGNGAVPPPWGRGRDGPLRTDVDRGHHLRCRLDGPGHRGEEHLACGDRQIPR